MLAVRLNTGMKTALKGVVAGATFVIVIGFAVAVMGFPSLPNPFRSETVVRDHAAVLQSLEDLSEYHAATGEYQVVVDIEDRTRYIPGFLKGERTTFLAQGSVDAVVDLGELGPDHVIVGEDGAITVLLPRASLAHPTIDHDASAVLDRDRGVLDRVGGVFSDEPTSDRELYIEAESRLADAASSSELVAKAETNTAAMIEELFTSAGFDDVRVVFQTPAELR